MAPDFVILPKMESVGQNATHFSKSQISANYFSAQLYYLLEIEKLVAKVSKVPIVSFRGQNNAYITILVLHH
jgi:hypothetical protein